MKETIQTNLLGRRAQVREPRDGETLYMRAGQWGEIVAVHPRECGRGDELILHLAMDDDERGQLYEIPALACRLEGVPGGATKPAQGTTHGD